MPHRIVSLVPSVTATLAELGLESEIKGCTKFCVDPPDLIRKSRSIGGTKDPDLNSIRDIAPDRILVNTEENRAVDIAACREIAPVLEMFPRTPKDIPDMLRAIGTFTGTRDRAESMAIETEIALADLAAAAHQSRTTGGPAVASETFVYLIWRNPWMAAGRDTYISHFLEMSGLRNAIDEDRYPEVSIRHLRQLKPGYVFFSSEPWPFRNRDCAAFAREWTDCGGTREDSSRPGLFKIDGRAMSWHGAETRRAATALRLWIVSGMKDCDLIRRAMLDEP